MALITRYRQNRFVFPDPKNLLRFLGCIGWANITRLSFTENIAVTLGFFDKDQGRELEILWLQRWTSDLRRHMKGAEILLPNLTEWLRDVRMSEDSKKERGEEEDLRKAIAGVNKVLDDAEQLEQALSAVQSTDAGVESNVQGRMRIQTLDLGERFADVDEQLRTMDLGIHDKDCDGREVREDLVGVTKITNGIR